MKPVHDFSALSNRRKKFRCLRRSLNEHHPHPMFQLWILQNDYSSSGGFLLFSQNLIEVSVAAPCSQTKQGGFDVCAFSLVSQNTTRLQEPIRAYIWLLRALKSRKKPSMCVLCSQRASPSPYVQSLETTK